MIDALTVKRKRAAAGLAGNVLCRKLGIARSRLSDIERGYVTAAPEELTRIDNALDELSRPNPLLIGLQPQWAGLRGCAMIDDQLTAILAERILHWRVAQGRFLMPGRVWKPAWRFQPTEKMEDAFRLLEAGTPSEYGISRRDGNVTVHVVIAGRVGEAVGPSEPRAITYAVARAIGLDPTDGPKPKTGADSR